MTVWNDMRRYLLNLYALFSIHNNKTVLSQCNNRRAEISSCGVEYNYYNKLYMAHDSKCTGQFKI